MDNTVLRGQIFVSANEILSGSIKTGKQDRAINLQLYCYVVYH